MTLNELLEIVHRAYPDEQTRLCWNARKQKVRTGTGDTLAEFIVREIADTFDPNVPTEKQLDEALSAMRWARNRAGGRHPSAGNGQGGEQGTGVPCRTQESLKRGGDAGLGRCPAPGMGVKCITRTKSRGMGYEDYTEKHDLGREPYVGGRLHARADRCVGGGHEDPGRHAECVGPAAGVREVGDHAAGMDRDVWTTATDAAAEAGVGREGRGKEAPMSGLFC